MHLVAWPYNFEDSTRFHASSLRITGVFAFRTTRLGAQLHGRYNFNPCWCIHHKCITFFQIFKDQPLRIKRKH